MNKTNSSTIITKTKKTVVYDAIKEQIISFKLEPGTILIERWLCAELNTSRTPVREALQQLAGEGLVCILPTKGCMVSEIRYEDVARTYDVREYLEGLAARLCAQSINKSQLDLLHVYIKSMEGLLHSPEKHNELFYADHLFHKHITECSGNDLLINIYNGSLSSQIRRITHLVGGYIEWVEEAHLSHSEIAAALEKHDQDLAEKLMREHVRNSKHRIIKRFLPNSL